jgi:site-specific DNA recombinase
MRKNSQDVVKPAIPRLRCAIYTRKSTEEGLDQQNLISPRTAGARGRTRNKHFALLSGLLYCESCVPRMVYSYSMKNGRKYPYYVCLNAQRKGRAVCPAKSLSARAIEESVLGRIREAHHGVFDRSEWEQMDRAQNVEAIQAVVERVGYDGTARQVSIRFHAEGRHEPQR